MITPEIAIFKMEAYRAELDIPKEARISYIEKRIIELTGLEKAELQSIYQGQKNNLNIEEGPEKNGKEGMPLVQIIVWVGRYIHRSLFWELTIDKDGKLVRLRKSR